MRVYKNHTMICPPVREIIHELKIVGYLLVLVDKLWYNYYISIDGWMDEPMTCDFTSFSTVFQSYQDDGRMVMKGFAK